MRKSLTVLLILVGMCLQANALTLEVEQGVVKLNQGKGFEIIDGSVEVKVGNQINLSKTARAKLIYANGSAIYLKPGVTSRVPGRTCVKKGPPASQALVSENGCAGDPGVPNSLADPGTLGNLGGVGNLAGVGGIGGAAPLLAAGAVAGAGLGAGISSVNAASQGAGINDALLALALQAANNTNPLSQ